MKPIGRLISRLRYSFSIKTIRVRGGGGGGGGGYYTVIKPSQGLSAYWLLSYCYYGSVLSPPPSVFFMTPQLQIICCYIARYYVRK